MVVMRYVRPLILALAIAGGFFYFTTWRSNSQGGLHPSNWFGRPDRVEITEAAPNESLDGEEQNNITVYRKNIPTTSLQMPSNWKSPCTIARSTGPPWWAPTRPTIWR